MKTDTLFYQLFQTFPTLLFELLELPLENARGYQFASVEIKEKAFRFDGIFQPDNPNDPTYFVEVQFQPKPHFYREFFTEAFLYLNQYPFVEHWQAVAIFASQTIDPGVSVAYAEFFQSNRVQRIYLTDLLDRSGSSIAVQTIQMMLLTEQAVLPVAKHLFANVQDDKIIKLIEAVLVYKFSHLTREEVLAMFTMSELQQTWIYQEAVQKGLQEGLQEGLQQGLQEGLQQGLQEGLQQGLQQGEQRGKSIGLQEGALLLLKKLIKRKFAEISPPIEMQLQALSTTQLESLGEAIFDFQTPSDLETWLAKLQQPKQP